MTGLLDHIRRVQQRLGGNAADVETDAAEGRITLDQDGIEAKVGAAERGGIAAGAGTDDDHLTFDISRLAGCGLRRWL